jgi:putative transposase
MSHAIDFRDRGAHQLRKGRTSIPGQVYHVTTRAVYRRPLFEDFHTGRLVVSCLKHEEERGRARTLCFVLMPDHLHWLLQITGTQTLFSVVNNVKAHSARRINCATCHSGAVWQKGFFDRAIRRDEDLVTVADYIVANPVRAGLVRDSCEYALWDSIWL